MSTGHRVVVVIENDKYKNPFEVWVLAALCLSSVLFLLGITPQDNSVAAVLPRWSTLLWAFLLATGTFTALVGMFWKQPAVGRTIQMAGHLWTATGALIYSSVLLYYIGAPAVMSGLTVGSIVIAAVFRVRQLRKQIKQILNKIEEQHDAGGLDIVVDGGE